MAFEERPADSVTNGGSDLGVTDVDGGAARDAAAARHGDEHGIEQHGIDIIPAVDRHGRPRDLFWFWMGVTFNIEFLVFGGLLPVIGLSFAESIIVILIGNLAWFVTGVMSLQGPAAGTSLFMITRAAYGNRGGRAVALFNWVSQVTYETIGLALVVLGSLALLSELGLQTTTGLKIIVIPVAAVIQLILPVFGHRTILRVLTLLVPVFIVLFGLLTILIAPKVVLAGHASSLSTVLLGLAIVGATGGFAFVVNGSDYTRYLPEHTSKRGIVCAVGLGGYIPSSLVMILGAAVASVAKGEFTVDPVSNLHHVLPAWFVIPYLLVVIAQVYAINSVDLYSSALSLQALGLPLRRWQAVLVDTVVCSGLTALAIFSTSFNQFVTDASLLLMIWIAPWAGIYLTDWWLRRGRYDPPSLVAARGGLYWRTGGWHIPAFIAQAAGMIVAGLAINTSVYPGPLSKLLWGDDFSIPLGFLVGATVYGVLARRSVPKEIPAETGPAASGAYQTAVPVATNGPGGQA
jgi:purine-cytosine permease-like protein